MSGGDVRNLQKGELRASATATEPLGESDPLPTVTLTFNAGNWNTRQFCAFWTYDDLVQRGSTTGVEAGQRWFNIGAQQSDITGSATISYHTGQSGAGAYRAIVNQNDQTTPTGPSTLRFFAVGASVAEGRSAWFDIVLSQPLDSGLTIPYTITPAASGGAGITAEDFTGGLTGTFTLTANNLRENDRQRIQIATPGGGASESAETFTVTLGPPTTGGGTNAPSLIFLQTSADKTILADDATDPAAATISIAASATDVDEGDSFDLTFTLSQAYSGEIRFRYGFSGIQNEDIIGGAGNRFAVIPANQLSLTIPIHVLVDGSVEAAETMTVDIHMAGSNLDGTTRWPSRANPPLQRHSSDYTVNIDIAASTDTDATAAAVATSAAIAEASSGSGTARPSGQAMFTVSLTGLRLQPSTVEYTITAAATNGASVGLFDASDGAAFPLTGRLTIPPGTNPQAALNIPILVPGDGDSVGGFVVTLTSIQFAETASATTLTGKTASGTVEGGARVWIARVTPATGEVSESTNPVYSLNYDGPAIADGAPVTVAWAVSAPAADDPDGDGPATAAEGRDFDTSDFSFPDGTHTFAAGMGGNGAISAQFTVELRDDIIEEGPEFFTVTIRITAPNNFDGYLSTSSITAVIAANDTPIPMTVSFVQSAAPTVPVTSFSVAESSDSDLTATPSTDHFICVAITELPEGVTDLGSTQVVVQLVATAGSAGVGEFSLATNQDPHLGSFRSGCTTLTVNNDLIPEDTETLTLSMRLDETFSRLAGAVTFGPDATVTITDSDPIVIELDAASYSVEEGDSLSVTAVMTAPASTVPIEIADWSAVVRIATSVESGDSAVQADFTAASQDFTFTNARRRHALRITTLDEDPGVVESAETFTVTLSEPAAIDRVTAADTAQVTITDDDNVAMPSGAVSVSEGDSAITWNLRSAVTLAEGAVVTYQLARDFSAAAGAAATAADLVPPSGAQTGSGAFPIILTHTIASGEDTAAAGGVDISTGYGVRDDNLNEGAETLLVTVLSADGAAADPANAGTVTIAADSGDATVIDSITLNTPAAPREGDEVYFTVRLSGGALTEDLQVAWTRSGDAEDADFTSASDSSPLTIPAGSTQGRIRLVLAEDADSPDTSTADGFTVTLDTPTSGNTDGGGDGVSLTGTTADQSASVTSISAAPTGGENTEAFYVTGGPLAEPAGAARNTQAGATYPQLFIHYFNSAGTNLSASTTVSISIVPAGGANNPIEHSSANGRDASPPATQGDIWRFRPGSHSDTPFVPPLQSMQTDQGFPTAAQLRGPTAVRNRDDNAVTFLASDNLADSIASCGSATSRSGCDENTHQVAAFVMDPNHDNLSEGVEHFWVYLSSDRGRVGPPLLVAVNDNADDALTVSIAPSPDAEGNSVADGTAFDEGSLARFTVSISGATVTSDVMVDYAISGANIEAGDFSGIASLTGHSVTIPVGRTSAEIVLTLAEDEVVELAESFTVTISNPRTAGAVSVGSAATANLGIAADPAGEAAITLTPRPDRNDVGNVITVPMFRVQLHRAGDTGTAMTFGQNVRLAATFGGTACHGTLGSTCGDAVPDYTRVSGGGVTYGSNYVELPAGTSAINLPGRIRGDPFNEGDETITITVTAITALPAGGGGYAALGGIALPAGGLSTTFTIANDDALTVTLVPAANAGGVPEGGSTSLRIELRGGSPHGRNDMTIGWAVMPTTDASDNDADPADFTATAGGTGGLASRPSGSFTIQRLFRSNPHFNAVGNGLRTVDLHITDEDLPDGDENFDIVVTLTNAGSDDVSFAGPHADGRAHYSIDAGRDQQRAFTLSGPTVNGAAAATVNEDGAEAMRTVTYTVTYTAHAMVLGIDDMAGGSALTGGAELTLTLGADSDPATRDAQFSGANNDFTDSAARTVTFAMGDPPGTAKTATFIIANDNRSEKAETFTVTLGGLAGDEGIDDSYIDETGDAHISTAAIAASDAVTWTLEPLAANAAEPATPADPAERPAADRFYFRVTPSPSLDTTQTGHAVLGNDNLERISLALEVRSPSGAATLFVDADGDGSHDTTTETPDYRIGVLSYTGTDGNALSAADIATGVVAETVAGCANAICVRVEVLSDDFSEVDETVNLRLTSLSALQSQVSINAAPAHASRNAVITISANDPLTISIGDAAAAVNEGTALQFPLTISGGLPAADLMFSFSVSGTGVTDGDFTGIASLAGSFTVTAAAASSPTLDLPTVRDNIMEGAETVTVTLTGVTLAGGNASLAGAAGGGERQGGGTISASTGDVRTLTVTGPASVTETDSDLESGNFTVAITANNAGDTAFGFSSDTVVTWTVTHGSTEDADFVAASDRTGEVTFAAADTADKTFTITFAGDDLNEGTETFTVQLSVSNADADGGTAFGGPASVNLRGDDDISITLSDPAGPTTEADGATAVFGVALSGGVRTGDVTVPLVIEGAADADYNITSPSGIDASATGLTVTFPGPSAMVTPTATASVNVVLTFVNDQVNEADKTVRLVAHDSDTPTAAGGISYALVEGFRDTSAEVTLADDDDLTFTVTPASGASVSEGATHTITLTPSGATTLAAAVTVGWSAGVEQSTEMDSGTNTAMNPDLEFVGTATPAGTAAAAMLSGRTVVFDAGTPLAAMTVQIRVNADALKEGQETATVAFTASAGNGGGRIATPADHTFDIPANEAAARTIAVTAPATVAEGRSITFTIAVSGAKVRETFSVAWRITGATGDLTGATDGTWMVPVSTSTGGGDDETVTHEVNVTATDDDLSEGAETFTLTLTDPCASQTFCRTGAGGVPTGTTYAGFPADAHFLVLATASAEVTIGESDRPVTVAIAAPGAGLTEGTASDFTVSFPENITTTAAVTADYTIGFPAATAAQDAAESADFNPVTGTATIPAGMRSANLAITALADSLFESSEAFTITLSNARGGGAIAAPVLAPATPAMDGDPASVAAATIRGSDPVTVSIDNPGGTVREGASAEFTVSLVLTSGGAAATTETPICVVFSTAIAAQRNPPGSPNSAANADIGVTDCASLAVTLDSDGAATTTANPGGVLIAAGQGMATLTIATLYDGIEESADEALTVTVISATDADAPANTFSYPAITVAASPGNAGGISIQNVNAARSISVAGPGAVDEGSSFTYTVTIDGEPVTEQFTLAWTLGTDSDGNTDDATLSGAGTDIETARSDSSPLTVPVSAERRQQLTITIYTAEDAAAEDDEVLTLTLTDPCASTPDADCSTGGRPPAFSAAPGVNVDTTPAAATIGQSDQTVTLQIAAPGTALEEALLTTQAAARGAFTVSFAESVTTTADIQVQWRLKFPTAVAGPDASRIVPAVAADFAAATGTAVIPAGMSSADITVTTAADHIQEPVETFIVELHGTPRGGGTIAGSGLTISTTAGEASHTIARSDDGNRDGMTIDMVSTAARTQTVDEGAEVTFGVRLFNNTPNEITNPSRATAAVSSVDLCVSYTVTITTQQGGASADNTVANHDLGGITDCAGDPVTLTDAADGATIATGGVLIPAGSNRQDFNIIARFDNLDEGDTDEALVVQITSAAPPMNSGLSNIHVPPNQNSRRTANINNINAARALSISGPASAVDEGGQLEFTVSVTGRAIETPFDVDWRVTAGAGDIDAAATATSGTLRFTAIGGQTISLTTRDDALNEAAETVTVTLTDPCPDSGVCAVGGRTGITNAATPALQLTGTSANGSIRESDRPVTVTIAAPAGDLAEGAASNFVVSFAESVTTTAAVTVNWQISFPTASTTVNPAVNADFPALTGSVDIPAGQATVNLGLTAVDDAVFEADEDFTVSLTSVSGGGAIAAPILAAAPRASAKIDAGDAVTVSLARASGQGATVVEGGTARFTVSLVLTADTVTAATAAAPICVMFGTAVDQQMTANTSAQGADIAVTDCAGAARTVAATTGVATGGVRIPAGSSSATLSIGARYDGYDEGMTAETLRVTMSSAADEDADFTYPAVTVDMTAASVGITNTNAARSVTVAGPGTVGEDAGTFDFTVTVTGEPVTAAFDIPWTITAGSATVSGSGADISSATSGMLNVPVASGRMQELTISVTVTDDSAAENDETLMLALTDICSGRAATECNFGGRPATGFDAAPTVVVSTTAATATIGQSDQTVTLQIAAPGGNLTEGTAANFTVSFSESVTTTSNITFSWVNNPGVTASADTAQSADFGQASLTGSATIPAGMSSVTIPITAADDAVSEGPETFTVRISSPTGGGAIVGSGLTVSDTDDSAQATISASDPVQVSLARRSGQSGAVIEGSNAEFTVSLVLTAATSTAATAANPICVTFRTEITAQQNPSGMANTASNADVEVRDCAGMTVAVVATGLTNDGGVIIPAGQSSATLRVLARYDDIDEGMTDEELTVQISAAAFQPALTGATAPVIDTNQETVSVDIQNTNALRTIAAETVTATVNEDETAFLFRITLNGNPPVSAFTVQWSVTDEENNPSTTAGGRVTASHGAAHEFNGGPSGSVTFPAGGTTPVSMDVPVTVRNDAYNEGAETLTLAVTDPCPASGTCEVGGRESTDPQAAPALALSRATSTVSVAASDPIALSIAGGPTALVAGQFAEYPLHFGCANGESGPGCTEVIPTTDLTVPLTVTVGGTAVTVPARMVARGSRTFTLTAAEINMGGENHGETLSVTPGAPTSLPGDATATVATGTTATETAVMGWTVTLSANRTSAPEGSTFEFTLTLNGAASELAGGGISVPWAITGAGDNAVRVDGDDFEGARSGTVEFTPASPVRQTVSVVTARNDDNNPDSDTEMFAFTIGALTGGDAARADIVGEDAQGMFALTATIGPPVDEDVAALNRVIMPEVARSIADSQMQAVSGRLRGGFGGGGAALAMNLGGQSSLSALAAQNLQALADDAVDWKRMAGNSAFQMPLGVGGGGGAAGTFWGGGEFRGIGGESGSTKWDGDLFSAHLGFDARLSAGLLGGLLLSYSEAAIEDYSRIDTTRSGRPAVKGDWLLEMTSLSPYLGWRGDSGVEGWALASYGSGDLDIEERGGRRASDVTLQTIGVGISGAVSKAGDRELRVKADVFATRAEVDDSKTVSGDQLGTILGDELSASRVRVLLDLRHTRALAGGASLDSSGEFGARYDNGDGRTGGGLELGGGMKYRNAALGLTLEGRTRGLIGHSADYDDWGISGAVKLEAGADGQGLSLSLSPAYGNTAGGSQAIWDGGLFSNGAGDDAAPELRARMDVKAGYGVKAFAGTGLLTPYSGVSFGDGQRSYRLGVEWNSGERLRLKLSGERLETDDTATTHGILFKGEMWF